MYRAKLIQGQAPPVPSHVCTSKPTRPKNGLLYGKYGVYQIKPVCPQLYEVWLQMGDEMEFIYILPQNESAEERG